MDQAQLLPGTLDRLILKAVPWGRFMATVYSCASGKSPKRALLVEPEELDPARFRLVRQGRLEAKCGTRTTIGRATFYKLTAAGGKHLIEEADAWNRLAVAIAATLASQPEEI